MMMINLESIIPDCAIKTAFMRQPDPNEAVIKYNPVAGTWLNHACLEACKMTATVEVVIFDFNGVLLVATQDSAPFEIATEYHRTREARSKAFRESAEGIAEEKKRKLEIETKQKKINLLISALPDVFGSEDIDRLMDWIKAFSGPADNVGVSVNYGALVGAFMAAGYRNNYGVGNDPDWFCTSDRLGKYIAGQVINCMMCGMPPHSVVDRFLWKFMVLLAREKNCQISRFDLVVGLTDKQFRWLFPDIPPLLDIPDSEYLRRIAMFTGAIPSELD